MKRWKPYYDPTSPWDQLCQKLHAVREAHWKAPALGDVDEFLRTNTPATPAIVVVGRISEWRPILDWYDDALKENPIG